MKKKVLYLGDGSLSGAAAYLSGVMAYKQIRFDYRPSDEKFCDDWFNNEYDAFIISDYPSENFTGKQHHHLAERIKEGVGLVMIGGWGSYVGLDGNYQNTPLADCLPVLMESSDDRMNVSSPCLISSETQHSISEGLPFETNAPVVGGFNAVQAKPGATTVLNMTIYNASKINHQIEFKIGKTYPLLVLDQYGLGRVASFTSDVAPHWVGGLVDWGDERINAHATGSHPIEVGCNYVELFARIIRWISNDSTL